MDTTPKIWADPDYDPSQLGPVMMAAPPAAADAGPPPMPKISMGGGAPPVFAPGPAPVVTKQPSPIETQIGATSSRLQDLQKHDTYDYSQHSKLRNIGHVLSKIGNVAGDIFAPATMSLIPGTDLNRQAQEGSLSSRLLGLTQQQSEDEARGATTRKTDAETAGLPGEQADKHDLTQATIGNLDSEAEERLHPHPQYEVHDTASGPLFVNKQTGQAQHLSVDGLPVGPKIQTDRAQLEIGGKPHQVLVNKDTGEVIKDLGESGEKPPVINNNAGATRQFQEQERGRGLLDKAEAAYRTAQQGANTMRDMVASADAGNKMSAQVLPLEGALAITTAQGVHRINRTEVDQYAGAGNLYDKIAGELGKVTSGQPIPPNIRSDIRKLTDIQEKGAYQTYKGAFDSATHRYGLKDEQALPGPGGAAGGMQSFTDNGVTYQIPAEHVADFKKDHPNAR